MLADAREQLRSRNKQYTEFTALCIACALVVMAPASNARTESGDDSSHQHTSVSTVVIDDAQTALGLALRTYTAPCRWNGSDWLNAGGIAAVSGLSFLGDADVRRSAGKSHSQTADDAVNIAVAYGDGLNAAIAVGGLYGIGLVVREPWLRTTMMLAGTATLVSASLSTVTKFIVGRARPYTGLGNHFFRPLAFSEDHVSFPSGHTVVAFSLSSVLSERIGNPWATVVLYGIATATAAGRIYQDQHWLSDVVPAALCSAVIGRSMVRWYEGDETESGLMILPGPGSITLVWHFNDASSRRLN